MRQILFTFLALFFSIPSFAAEIDSGISKIDFDGDGVEETVVKGWRGNSNAHGFYGISFYKSGPDEQLILIPVEDQNMVTTLQGADCTLRDYRIFKDDQKNILVSAAREMGKGYVDSKIVTFEIFEIVDNNDRTSGFPDWSFKKVKTMKTIKTYCDVIEAYEQEFQNLIK